jgi:hypothetical protein
MKRLRLNMTLKLSATGASQQLARAVYFLLFAPLRDSFEVGIQFAANFRDLSLGQLYRRTVSWRVL